MKAVYNDDKRNARKRKRRANQQKRMNRRGRQHQPSTLGQKIFGPIAGFGGIIALKKAIDRATGTD
jgi:hypothetical protein|tara:strand:- start:2703 stop:2900 length:198 start_codon:yes stop_codon:yes gene_type:complete